MNLQKQITAVLLDWEYGMSIEQVATKHKLTQPFLEAMLTGFYGPSKREPNPIVGE